MPHVRLKTVELALDHHAALCTVADTVPDDHMDIDARHLAEGAGDMKLSGSLGIVLVQVSALHALLYTESGPVKGQQTDDVLVGFEACIKEI